MMAAAQALAGQHGVAASCRAMAVSRATFYRVGQPRPSSRRRPPPRSLTLHEKYVVLDTLNSERFVDHAPVEIYATLLDEDVYLCSVRTMYRILAGAKQVRERRRQARRPAYVKPELLATGPNQLWCWDITKLRGPGRWQYFHLYTMLDVYSRYVVGWLLADREDKCLAGDLVTESCRKQGILPGQLTIHSDRGSAMVANSMTQLMASLGVTKTHSRPYVSDDNPFIESHFKTLKYRPTYPQHGFGCLDDGLAFVRPFYEWYNNQHRHGGIAYLTPAAVHYGRAAVALEARHSRLTAAYDAHPARFVKGLPRCAEVPHAVWINPPRPPAAPVSSVPVTPSAEAALAIFEALTAPCAPVVDMLGSP